MKSAGLVLVLILTAIVWDACQKENVPIDNSNVLPEQLSTPREGVNCGQVKNTVYKSDGMLVFADEQHFNDCIECLEQELEAYNDACESQYSTATAEQLDVLDSINNFNEWQPLVDFETSKSFTSLRSIVEQQSNQWLDAQITESINFDNDPDILCPILDEETRALFNTDGYVKIGSNIVSAQDWADVALSLGDCCAWRRSSKYTFDANDHATKLANRQVKAKIAVRSRLFRSTLEGKITHYRKVNGKYKKRRADMRLGVSGIGFYGEGCTESIQVWDRDKSFKKRRTRTVVASILSLWREAIVCKDDERWWSKRSGLYFYVDNEDYQFLVYLAK